MIVRYLRFRHGLTPNQDKDAVAIYNGTNVIFDHVSVSWGRDENFSITGSSGNITVQNSIIAEGLDPHSAGGLIEPNPRYGGVSILRSLYLNNRTRNPKAKGDGQFVNNVIYDWRLIGFILGDSSGVSRWNVVNNYLIDGPAVNGPAFGEGNSNFQLYASGNRRDSNRNGILDGSVISQSSYGPVTWRATPFAYPEVTTLTAQEAYVAIVAEAGASLSRDSIDARLINHVRSLGTQGQIISDPARVGGFGTLNGGPALPDSDRDGMPDGWESYYGLNAGNASDRNGDFDGTGYTNLEKYLNGIADGSYPWSYDPVPEPWTAGDVGEVSLAGTAGYGNGVFVVSGSGEIAGAADTFQLVSQTFSGDGSISARIGSQTNTDGFAKAGIMFRNSAVADAAFADVVTTPGGGGRVMFFWRSVDGGTASYSTAYHALPVWVKLARSGNSFTASYSADGFEWTQIGSPRTVYLSPDALAGLVVGSNNSSALGTATFSDVSLIPAGWANAEIGSPPLRGGATFDQSTGTWTLRGNGNDVTGTADQLHYAYRSVTGDGYLLARVGSVQDTSPAAEAGVMIRETLEANSRQATLFVTPADGISFQRRINPGDTSASTAQPKLAAPYWLYLERSGDTFSAWSTADMVDWEFIGSETISMSSTVYVGMAVSSRNASAVNTSTFDNISVVWQVTAPQKPAQQ